MRTALRKGAAPAAALLLAATPLAAAPVATAQEPTVECDGKWHFESEGDPVLKREIADKFTLDNRNGPEPLDQTVRTKESLTKTFSNQVDLGFEVGAEASAGFGAFSASVQTKFSASYGFSLTDTNTVEKETEVRLVAGPGVGYTRYVGIESVQVTGYYERILDCDKKTQRYQRIGPVTEEAPTRGKAVWTEALPNSK
nr:ETX/MTX2 family pore-forming toxin [Kitasatospora sp. SID7827]